MICSNPKILLIGGSGQVGSALLEILENKNNIISPKNFYFLNLTSEDLEKKLSNLNPNIIINTLAYTLVDEAENDKKNAFALNTLFPTILAKWCYENNCLLVHFSSDYVFSGKGTIPRTEDSNTNPINYYGLTKLKGDLAIKNSKANSVILRCSWIYSFSHNSFLKTIINKMQIENELNIVDDQIGTPTSARWVAEVTKKLFTNPKLTNGFHLINCVPDGFASWYEFSILIFELIKKGKFNIKTKCINPITSKLLVHSAKRPKNSRLCNKKLKFLLNTKVPDWKTIFKNEFNNL
jgi:dTDP-4-dehydrorhamnose reductase